MPHLLPWKTLAPETRAASFTYEDSPDKSTIDYLVTSDGFNVELTMKRTNPKGEKFRTRVMAVESIGGGITDAEALHKKLMLHYFGAKQKAENAA